MRFIFLFFSLVFASYEDFKTHFQKEFNEYKAKETKEFINYKKRLKKEFEKYKKEISKYWTNPKILSKKEFVEYSKDLKTQKIIDFENRKVTISVLAKNKKEAEKKIKNALEELKKESINDAYNNTPLKKISPAKLPNKPLIDELSTSFNPKNIQKKYSKIPGEFEFSLTISLPSNFYIKKAKLYKNDVFKDSQKFKLLPSLIYAIIHTESAFNPLATSFVPAYGLMQIVPKTAGRDAAKFLYKKDIIFPPKFLYNPSNNILIGSAYFHLLFFKYFKEIKNPLSRLYLSIAAYNTGAGHVACVFNSKNFNYKNEVMCYRYRGDYSIKKAANKINSLTPNEVYFTLINHLPYQETKDYLKKVKKRMYKYHLAIKKNLI